MKSSPVPDGVPVLSRGRHRSPRRGACFMEFASFLAGERWSDHPSCTHPLLAQLARQVNDHIGDADRQQLVPLIPMVVGRRGDDRTWLTLPVTVAAEPILDVPEATQRVLAAGLMRAEQLCADAGPDLAETGRGRARPRPCRCHVAPTAAGGSSTDHSSDLRRPMRPDDGPVHRRRHRGEWHARPRPPPARPARGGHRRLSGVAQGERAGGLRSVRVAVSEPSADLRSRRPLGGRTLHVDPSELPQGRRGADVLPRGHALYLRPSPS
jgi:hypothetical protein